MAGASFRVQQLLSLKGQAPTNVALKCFNEEQFYALDPELQEQFVQCLEIDSGHPVGCRATRASDYVTFDWFFKTVIESYHTFKLDFHKLEHSWVLQGLDEKTREQKEIPVRLRAWRNLADQPFACVATPEDHKKIEEATTGALKQLIAHPEFGGRYISFSEPSDEDKVDIAGLANFSDDKYSGQPGSGVYISHNKSCVVWVNHSDRADHLLVDVRTTLKQLCLAFPSTSSSVETKDSPSSSPDTAPSPLAHLQLCLSLIEQSVAFAVSPQFGYLSVNPVLCGVGMSASTVLSLPNLIGASSPGLAEVCGHLTLTPNVLSSSSSVEIRSVEFWASEAKLVKTLCAGAHRLFLADELSTPEAQAAHQETALEKEIKLAYKGEQMWGPMTELLDWLFLGSRFNAANEKRLKDKGIVQIINVAKDCPNWFAGRTSSQYQPAYYNVAIEDSATEQILPYVDAVTDLMEQCRKSGKNVLIHCNCGVSRSAAFVAAYLLKYKYHNKDDSVAATLENPTVRDTLDWLRAKRNIACPNQGFVEQLMKYNKETAYGVVQKKQCVIS